MYNLFADSSTDFIGFFLFIATSIAVTALSILSRVLVELNIIQTKLGAIAIAAGVCNDSIGYILLAISTAVSSGGDQLSALWELLCLIGAVLLEWFIVRHIISYFYRRNDYNLTTGVAALVLVGAMISAWFTDILGLHPMVGAFAFGACCPHDHDFPEKMTKRIETPVMIFLLPLYYVVSGINTNFILLSDGKSWGIIFLLIIATFITKGGCTAVSAKLVGLEWRQAFCVGILMQSKGVIELVILNVGLELGVISDLVYAQLVMVCILSTLCVRPIADWVYLNRVDLNAHPIKDSEEKDIEKTIIPSPSYEQNDDLIKTLVVVLNSSSPPLSPVLSFISLLSNSPNLNISNLHLHTIDVTSREYITRATVAEHLGHSRLNVNSQGSALMESLDTFEKLFNLKLKGESKSLLAERDEQVRLTDEFVDDMNNKNGMVITPWIPSGAIFSDIGKSRSFAGLLLKKLNHSIGVVVQPSDIINSNKLLYEDSDIKVHDHSLNNQKPKVILPYFGGKDDDEALDLMNKMSESHQLDCHLIKFKIKSESEETKAEQFRELTNLPTTSKPFSHDDTIHAQITMVAPGIKQARGLSTVFDSESSNGSLTNNDNDSVNEIEVDAENILDVCIDKVHNQLLTNSTPNDIILVGRGKLDQQRTSLFRTQADNILKSNQHKIANDEKNEIIDLGKVLGSVAQTLAFELGTSTYQRPGKGCPQLLVVQSHNH